MCQHWYKSISNKPLITSSNVHVPWIKFRSTCPASSLTLTGTDLRSSEIPAPCYLWPHHLTGDISSHHLICAQGHDEHFVNKHKILRRSEMRQGELGMAGMSEHQEWACHVLIVSGLWIRLLAIWSRPGVRALLLRNIASSSCHLV